MDLQQRKLTKYEWDALEVPVSKTELDILHLITAGYSNLQIRSHSTESLIAYLKMEPNRQIEDYLYVKFFADEIKSMVDTYRLSFIQFGTDKRGTGGIGGTGTESAVLRDDGTCCISVSSIVRLKSSDQIRVAQSQRTDRSYDDVYDMVLFRTWKDLIVGQGQGQGQKAYYTLWNLMQNQIAHVNPILKTILQATLTNWESRISLVSIVENAVEMIEKNKALLQYADTTLYQHQKQIFAAFYRSRPKLVLYTAPTGTGKTLTPLGLSEQYRIIFVCAARHVGLALAKSAISVGKKIAFAFGCQNPEDVRLHYFAAKDYTTDKRSGRICKVDNTNGLKVEMIICDIRSYLPSMRYMLSFNPADRIIMYWDEPTITLDCRTTHELHQTIHENWKHNVIPNVVLSSATLPSPEDIPDTIVDFKTRFPSAEVIRIVSHDCRKTIPLIDNNGYVVMPHHLHADYPSLQQVVAHCESNKTLLRYLDLKEACDVIRFFVNAQAQTQTQTQAQTQTTPGIEPMASIDRNFLSMEDVTMMNIKLYYLKVLSHIQQGVEVWPALYEHFMQTRQPRIVPNVGITAKGVRDTKGNRTKQQEQEQGQPRATQDGTCGIYVTTKDAYTLTDGPTLFLANDLQKIAKFCIQQANVPASVMESIMDQIEYNNQLNQSIDKLERDLECEEIKMASKMEDKTSDTSDAAKQVMGGRKSKKEVGKIASQLINKTEDKKIAKMRDDMDTLKSMVRHARLDDLFIPNRLIHLEKWAPSSSSSSLLTSFTSKIEESDVAAIMLLHDVEDSWKILLLLGIGVFTNHHSITYTEIMKRLADRQQLYLIIADSDYIYGTNYQFCHGYLSKDLISTQETVIQQLGRIGRSHVQQDYTVRFRDQSHIQLLFQRCLPEDKPEVVNMNRLFTSQTLFEHELEVEAMADDEEEEEEEDNQIKLM